MLHSLRAASKSWVGTLLSALLMGVMVISFAVFGVSSYLNGSSSETIAEIGNQKISSDEFKRAFAQQISEINQRSGQKFTNDDALAAGLERNLLDQMIGDAVLDQRLKTLDLRISDQTFQTLLTQDTRFLDPSGRFNPALYQQYVTASNLPEQAFLAEQRNFYLRRAIDEAIIGGLRAPQLLTEQIFHWNEEVRSIDYVELPASAAGEIAAPSEEQLQKYFAARAALYRAPEYRRIVALKLSPDMFISPNDVAKRYEDLKASQFSVPEKRTIRQIPYSSEDEAKTAYDQFKNGKTFDELVSARGLKDADTVLGTVDANTKSIPEDTRKIVFSLQQGVISEPVKNILGYSLLQVTAIEPSEIMPFEKVEKAVRADLARTEGEAKMRQAQDKIEEVRANGKPLDQAAQAAGQQVLQFEAVDAAGLDAEGKTLAALPDPNVLLPAAFSSEIGFDNDVLHARDGGLIWYEITRIDPARPRELAEVHDKVAAAWKSDQLNKTLTSIAEHFVQQTASGATLAGFAVEHGNLEIKHNNTIKRTGQSALPLAVLAPVFNTPVGQAGSAAGANEGRIVFVVLDAQAPAFDPESEAVKKLTDEGDRILREDLTTNYIQDSRKALGVTIYEDALQRAVPRGTK